MSQLERYTEPPDLMSIIQDLTRRVETLEKRGVPKGPVGSDTGPDRSIPMPGG